MTTRKFKGAIFDLDGVITATAKVHALAWEELFNEFLQKKAEQSNTPFIPFDPNKDYLDYVDGKPRLEGIKSFLASRGIEVPIGSKDDSDQMETLHGLGNKKNAKFQEIIKSGNLEVFDSTVEFITKLKKKGIKIGIASSSKNCKFILEITNLEHLFATRVDGIVSEEMGLKGKPHGDIFVAAAKNLGLTPNECIVVEDANSGVQAARNGNFGLTLGIARHYNRKALKKNGADIVVCDLSEINIGELYSWFESGINHDGWTLSYNNFVPEEEKLREALCTLGNGRMGTRGCYEGERAGEYHYPGTYIAGIYNKLATKIQDRNIYNNDFVNCINWTLIEIKIGNKGFISPFNMDILGHKQTLNMRLGTLERSIICEDMLGRITRIKSIRLVSMHDPYVGAISFEITPINYSCPVTVRSALDGNLINDGVARYRELNQKHLSFVASGNNKDGIYLHLQTSKSKYQLATSCKNLLFENGKQIKVSRQIIKSKAFIGEDLSFVAQENCTYRLEKLISIYTSQDPGVKNPLRNSITKMHQLIRFKNIYTTHTKAWERLWERTDIKIEGDRFSQKVVRLHIFHLLITASPHNKNIDAGMPARGLHGEAYRGHIFWDELYILPFYNLHAPEIAKALLMYRYRRLDAAKKYAKENGYKGAMYPWQTADDGQEETQIVHFNPQNNSWGPDLSRLQRHVSIAVFYNFWKYVADTNDIKFLHQYAAEVMVEIARFWSSATHLEGEKYHISKVMGPDEFHEKLPGDSQAGLTDNAYTNIMVIWLLEKTLQLLEKLPKNLQEKLVVNKAEKQKWADICQRLNVIITPEEILSQFKGYMELKELDWEHYRNTYGNIHRLDRILKAEEDSPDNYKLAKQADVLMTFYVLSPEEVVRILNKVGISVGNSLEFLQKNYQYYEQRTSHGSTLSKIVHAVISSYFDSKEITWKWFLEGMESDINDTQGGTTPEGIHSGVMAGTIDIITRHFAGINTLEQQLAINPHLPQDWVELSFRLCHHNRWYQLEFTRHHLKITLLDGKSPQEVRIQGKIIKLFPQKTKSVRYLEKK